MKIISYNVNGIRAAMRKGLVEWLQNSNPDVFCIQETKAMQEQVEVEVIENLGYHHYWHSAEKKGYSGVAIFSKQKPKHVEYGTGVDALDGEGRVIRADFDTHSVISLYLPSGTNMDRLDFKMDFCHAFSSYIRELKKTHPNLVICGDYNICHQAIDIHDPVRNKNVSGFLPVEREWLSHFMSHCDMVDAFRNFDDSPHQYTWWSYRANARNNNKGWRIDYAMVAKEIETHMSRCVHLPDAKHSDHCPVMLELDFN